MERPEQALHFRFENAAFNRIQAGHRVAEVVDAVHHQCAHPGEVALGIIGALHPARLRIHGKIAAQVLVEAQDKIIVGFLAAQHIFRILAGRAVAVAHPLKVDPVDARIRPHVGAAAQQQAQIIGDLVFEGDVAHQAVFLVGEGQSFLDEKRVGEKRVLPVGRIGIGGFAGQGTLNVRVRVVAPVLVLLPRNVPVRPDELLPIGETPVFGAGLDVFARHRCAELGSEVVGRVELEVAAFKIVLVGDAFLIEPPERQPETALVVAARQSHIVGDGPAGLPELAPVAGLRGQRGGCRAAPPLAHLPPIHGCAPAFVRTVRARQRSRRAVSRPVLADGCRMGY